MRKNEKTKKALIIFTQINFYKKSDSYLNYFKIVKVNISDIIKIMENFSKVKFPQYYTIFSPKCSLNILPGRLLETCRRANYSKHSFKLPHYYTSL